MKRIAVLVSGGGTNLQALIDAEKRGGIKGGRLSLVLSEKPGAYALERARAAGIKTAVVELEKEKGRAEFERRMLDLLGAEKIDLIVLAGFMRVLSASFISRYENRMINVHPSLIPSFCGDGFYGLRVHQAALAKGVKVSGATVHFVNEITDGGAIILQKAVEVREGDTPEILQKRIMQQAEWKLLPEAVSLFCEGRLKVENGRVKITEKSEVENNA